MLAKRYLEHKLQRIPADQIDLPRTLPELRRLAALRQLLFLSPELLVTPYSLRNVFPTAGQTKAHRTEALCLAAGLANTDPDPLFRPLRADQPSASAHMRLVRASECNATAGRAVDAIIQQIKLSNGEAVLLLRGNELVAVFDLFQTLQPAVDTVCSQLTDLGITLLILSDGPLALLPNIAVAPLMTDALRADGGLLRLDETIMLTVSGVVTVTLRLERLTDLPIALQRARQLVRPLFWLPNSSH